MAKKFKNVNSQILFLGSSFNFDYLSITQFFKGYSKKFIFSIPYKLIYMIKLIIKIMLL